MNLMQQRSKARKAVLIDSRMQLITQKCHMKVSNLLCTHKRESQQRSYWRRPTRSLNREATGVDPQERVSAEKLLAKTHKRVSAEKLLV